nr:dihydrofolate reductase family protein [Angustibacter aerolatus]
MSVTVSLDGFMAGPDQSLEHPMGVNGHSTFGWAFGTTWFGAEQPGDPVDERWAAQGWQGFGATIMGRNMFGPVRGPWGDSDWRGWWGDEPPYHHPVFVLTHHAHDPIEMQGGTTFHFVTDGIESALAQAMDAAGGLDVRLGGGASAIRQYLRAGLVDDAHLAIAPVLLGRGERLLDFADGLPGYSCTEPRVVGAGRPRAPVALGGHRRGLTLVEGAHRRRDEQRPGEGGADRRDDRAGVVHGEPDREQQQQAGRAVPQRRAVVVGALQRPRAPGSTAASAPARRTPRRTG